MKKSAEKIFGAIIYISMWCPLLCMACIGRTHNCHDFGECLRIWNDSGSGVCIENAVDEFTMAISIAWPFCLYGGAMVLSRTKAAIGPFVVLLMLIGASVFIAFIDPKKWPFVITQIFSFTLFLSAALYDEHNRNTRK